MAAFRFTAGITDDINLFPLLDLATDKSQPLDSYRGIIATLAACSMIEAYLNIALTVAIRERERFPQSHLIGLKTDKGKKVTVATRMADKLKAILCAHDPDSLETETYKHFSNLVSIRNSIAHWEPIMLNVTSGPNGWEAEEILSEVHFLTQNGIIELPKHRPVMLSYALEQPGYLPWVRKATLEMLSLLMEGMSVHSPKLDGYKRFKDRSTADGVPDHVAVVVSPLPDHQPMDAERLNLMVPKTKTEFRPK